MIITKKDMRKALFIIKYPRLYNIFFRLKYFFFGIRYKMLVDKKTHKIYRKDRLLFWTKPKDIGGLLF